MTILEKLVHIKNSKSILANIAQLRLHKACFLTIILTLKIDIKSNLCFKFLKIYSFGLRLDISDNLKDRAIIFKNQVKELIENLK